MKVLLFFTFFTLTSAFLYSQGDTLYVKGIVTEEMTNNPIADVVLYDVENNFLLGTTDTNGMFNVSMGAGRKIIKFILMGYQPVVVEVDVRPIMEFISVSLEINPVEIGAVNVVASKP